MQPAGEHRSDSMKRIRPLATAICVTGALRREVRMGEGRVVWVKPKNYSVDITKWDGGRTGEGGMVRGGERSY